jgi:hypothetical protein
MKTHPKKMSQCIKETRRKIKISTQSSLKMPKFTKWNPSKDCNPNETHQQSSSLLQNFLVQTSFCHKYLYYKNLYEKFLAIVSIAKLLVASS